MGLFEQVSNIYGFLFEILHLSLKNLVACGKVMSSKADETLRSGTNANLLTALLWKRTFVVNSGVIFNKKINRMGHLVIEFLRRI